MSVEGPSRTERFLAALPAWLLVTGGMLMLSAALLVPAMIDTQRLTHQRDHMREQAAAMEKLAGNYKSFHLALQENDPVVLERLAYAQLRRKPAGSEPLLVAVNPGQPVTPQGWMRTTSVRGSANAAASTTQLAEPPPEVASVESLIGDPAIIATADMPLYEPPRGRIIRLTTGSMRVGFMIAATGLVIAGLMWNTTLTDDESQDGSAEDDSETSNASPDDAEQWVHAELDEDDLDRP